MPQSTAFRAFWTAFNSYSTPGFSAYPEEGRFEDIYRAVQAHNQESWAMAEGTRAGPLGVNWERCDYDWSRPGRVSAPVKDSNVYEPAGSSWEKAPGSYRPARTCS